MKVAVAQLNYTIGAFDANKMKIVEAIEKAKKAGAEVAVFAEYAISGAPAYDLLNKVQFLEMCEEALIEIAAFCDNITVVIGLPIQHSQQTLSAAAIIQNRQVVSFVTKRDLNQRDEAPYLASGDGCDYFFIGGHKVAVVLGKDALNTNYVRATDTVIFLDADRWRRRRIERRYAYMAERGFITERNLVYVNQLGGHTDTIFDGSSAVFNHKGEAIALLDSFKEDFVVVDLDADNKPIEIPYQDKTVNTMSAIKLGLKDFFEKNGFKSACLGLSGGIDSAVVAAIAADVLGPENVRVLLMPSQFSSDHSVDDSVEMAKNLGLKYDIVPITDAYRVVTEAMAPVLGESSEVGVTEENIQSRLRCVMLMALSNKYGDVLLNTTNKSELTLGYSTLYGDSAGVLSILGDVYKRDVYALANLINREREIIPQSIIDKEPSAELRPDQKDTDYMPPYDIVDAIIYRMLEEGQSREEIINAGFDSEVVYKIYGNILRNVQKRHQFCPVLRISYCTFGKDRVMPLTSKYGF
ncbi:MAG: NAD+ synthase [Tidjanibacter sp.]|nr:NAD+ synthase [Tidjanibacter sp.]